MVWFLSITFLISLENKETSASKNWNMVQLELKKKLDAVKPKDNDPLTEPATNLSPKPRAEETQPSTAPSPQQILNIENQPTKEATPLSLSRNKVKSVRKIQTNDRS